MIKQRIVIALLLCLVLTAAGCSTAGKQQNEKDPQPVTPSVNQTGNGQVNGQSQAKGQDTDKSKPVDGSDSTIVPKEDQPNPAADSKPSVIVKSTSSVSDKELKATYDEIDKELDSLIKELDNVDTPVECSPGLTDS